MAFPIGGARGRGGATRRYCVRFPVAPKMEGKLPERPGRIPRAPAVKNIATPCDPFPNLFFPKMLPNTDIVSSSLPSDSETSYTTPPPPLSSPFFIKNKDTSLHLPIWNFIRSPQSNASLTAGPLCLHLPAHAGRVTC